uniref:trichohyalin-like n=1 Tax=Oncorhynchus gorbuscha TaxID=8017 RepID=UPI001EAE9AB8|nr:trichohyalin-like [Oncorhynchus gorbuscha]
MMASGAGKAPQPPGPGSGSLNGTAADLPNIEQELYDYQMHGKMCKKIAQLTKVIYSLNTKNEEQEAALQAVSHAHQEELRRVQVDFESYRVQAEERDRGVEAELRRDYEEKLQALGLERQETQAQLNTAHDESLRLGRELETAGRLRSAWGFNEEARREERRQWEQREEEEKRGMSTVLRERVRKAEGEMEGSLQRLNESKRHAAKLQDRIQDLEEELESGRRRVSGAEGGAKRAWEELVVAKERLLLQEEELQSKSEELLSRGVCEGCVCVNVEELKGQVNKLQSRNRELELQSSGRNNDYARQHAEALASLRSEMVRAQSEELRRERKHAEVEKEQMQKEMEEEKDRLQKEREEERERLQNEIEEERDRLQKERRESLNREKKRLKEQADEERRRLKEQADEERRRLKEQADEERRRLKEQVKKAIEEVMRKHAAELHNAQEALRTNQEEDRRSGEEVCRRLETERAELRDQLQQATNQEMERQRESYQRETTGLRTDKQRLEEKVLELNQQTQENTDRNVLEHNQENTDRNVLEHNQENTDRNVLEHNQENTDERIRSECEERLRAELEAELDAAVAMSNQREQELQTQLADLQSQVERKAGPAEGHHDDSEIDRLRWEVQETRDMNQRLREQLQEEPKRHSEERHSAALQALERRAQEELQTERNRLHTLHLLQLDKQGTELSQQYTEWSRQLTQRHMKHIEDLQTELHTHTEMMALQQDLKQQNQYQVFERQLDESRCAVLELQRENTVLRSGEEAMGREREQKEREEEAQRLRVEVDRLRLEVEKLEEAQKQREEQREEEMREEEARREMEEKRRDEEKRTEEENREEERREEVKRVHRRAMQSLVCEYSSCQAELQTRIVALETELREREERCRRREVPLSDDLQMGRLQERLTERNQLIKRLVEKEEHSCIHPPVPGDPTLRLHDSTPGRYTL